jgi:predicted DNA-binding transcriptional regulator AlpA
VDKWTQKVLNDINQVKATLGYKSTTSIYELMKTQGFPKPINIGNRTKRWVESEVQGWIKKQIESSRGEV